MSHRRIIATFPILLVLGACASSSSARVVRTEGDRLAVVSVAKNEPDARMSAVNEAIQHCERQKSEAVFPDRELGEGRRSGTHLDLSRLPVIGKVFQGGDKTQVVLGFRCEGGRSA